MGNQKYIQYTRRGNTMVFSVLFSLPSLIIPNIPVDFSDSQQRVYVSTELCISSNSFLGVIPNLQLVIAHIHTFFLVHFAFPSVYYNLLAVNSAWHFITWSLSVVRYFCNSLQLDFGFITLNNLLSAANFVTSCHLLPFSKSLTNIWNGTGPCRTPLIISFCCEMIYFFLPFASIF